MANLWKSTIRSGLAITLSAVLMGQQAQPPAAPAGTPPATPPAQAPATTPATAAPAAAGGALGGLNLDGVSLSAAIEILAKNLKINYILDPKVAGRVTINTYGEIKPVDV